MMPLLNLTITITLSCYGIAMAVSLIRLFKGPASQDKILVADFFYNMGILVVLVLGIRSASTMYFEVALLIALFGFISAMALSKFLLRGEVIE